MEPENIYKEFSAKKVKIYKKGWDNSFFRGVSIVDYGEILFIVIGVFTFFCLSLVFETLFIIVLVLFYWFRIKYVEQKIIEAKKILVLGAKFINEDFKGRGVTEEGAEPHYRGHRNGFKEYIDFLETQRKHLVARMVILNLFALVLLEIIKPK